MSRPFVADALSHIDNLLDMQKGMTWDRNGNYEYVPDDQAVEFRARCLTCFERVSGENSRYTRQARDEIQQAAPRNTDAVKPLTALLRALRADVEAGYVESLVVEVRTDLFADFLESADNLLNEGQYGYKDAAAVLAGGVLEQHLRKLCEQNGVDTTRDTKDGPQARHAADLNADLARGKVYSKIDQNTITAWLNIRNDAAHGQYDKYVKSQVALMVQWLRDFISRCPA